MSDAPSDPNGGDPRQEAEQLYVEFLGSDEASLTDGFERLAQRHPQLEDELRSLHADFENLERVLDEAAASPEFPFEELSRLHARGGHKRYRIEGEIARGGQGAVMRIWDSDLKRHLAMKLTLGRVTSSSAGDGNSPTPASSTPPLDSRTIHRFLNEAKITGQLDHPGIVPIHELGVDDDGQAYFTMKLVNGHSLHEIFHRHRQGDPEWTTQRCVGLILKATEAVAYAHSKGIIHRDLKPANIMVGEYGEVYVMDWGMARDLESQRDLDPGDSRTPAGGRPVSGGFETMEGSVLGTPAYMSPEQARGEVQTLDRRTDVYSLGAILYELLTGHAPYRDLDPDQNDGGILGTISQRAPTPISRELHGAHPELESIANQAMEREVGRRYPSAEAALSDLRAHVENRLVGAHEYGVVAELRKWVERNRQLAVAIGLIVFVGALGAAGVLRTQQLRAQESSRAEDLKRLQRDTQAARLLAERIEDPWPISPAWTGAWQSWIDEYDRLTALRPSLERILQDHGKDVEWRGEGESSSFGQAASRWSAARQSGVGSYLQAVEDWMASGERNPADVAVLQAQVDGLRIEQEALARSEVRDDVDSLLAGVQPTLLNVAGRLLAELDYLESPELSLREQGERALVSIRELSGLSSEYADEWAKVVDEVADFMANPIYKGLQLRPEPNLVPLRLNPATGLYEFWAPVSGSRPELSEDGEWRIGPESGAIFVLMPPGTVDMGVQSLEPSAARFDPRAVSQDEPPFGSVTLDAFYLSVHEMTQGQWKRLTGEQPSEYYAGYSPRGFPRLDWNHPVESISQAAAQEALSRWGMGLPTEAQWEYAAIAGGDPEFGPYSSDYELALVASRDGAEWDELRKIETAYPVVTPDGHLYHAPVGSLPPNPLGLHDMYGNVAEWCADYSPDSLKPGYVESVHAGDGRLLATASILVSYRGSHFLTKRGSIRISGRYRSSPRGSRPVIGVRPAMAAVLAN